MFQTKQQCVDNWHDTRFIIQIFRIIDISLSMNTITRLKRGGFSIAKLHCKGTEWVVILGSPSSSGAVTYKTVAAVYILFY